MMPWAAMKTSAKLLLLLGLSAVTLQPLHAQVVVGFGGGPQTNASWTSSTPLNATVNSQTGQGASVSPDYNLVAITFNPTGTVSGGVATFEVTSDPTGNSNFQPLICTRLGTTTTESTYTLSGAAQTWQCNIAGLAVARVRLSSGVTGSGTAVMSIKATAAIARGGGGGGAGTPTFPVTVAGTVTSGGIPCFTSTTTEASSGLLTANLPVIGGGAGGCVSVGTVTGNTTKFVTGSGAYTNTHGLVVDVNGNIVDSGGVPAGGTGNAGALVSVTSAATVNFPCPSSSAATTVIFAVSALAANISSSTQNTQVCNASMLVFHFVQNATGGFTVAMPTGFKPCFVNPAANIGTTCAYAWDGTTNGWLGGNTADAGYSSGQCVAAPGTPPASDFFSWCDSTNNVFSFKANNSATISNTVVPNTGGANQFLTSISAAGVVGAAQPTLTNLAAATANTTYADGNNTLTVNCAQTANNQNCVTVGETSAATGGTLTNALANQTGLQASTASASTAAPLSVVQGSVTGTTGPAAIQAQTTWNNASLVGEGILFNATNTASAAASKLLDLRVGNTAQFTADKAGNAVALTSVQTTASAPACTAGTAGAWCATEGTEFTNVASASGLYPDSTTHEFMGKTNGASTKGMMVRAQPGAVNQTAQTAAIGTSTLCAASAGACNIAGQYHVSWNFWGSGTACSSVTAGSVTFLLSWTDENAVAHAAVAEQMQVQTGAATTAVQASFPFQTALANESGSGDVTISTNGSVIQYATGYTACTTGTGTYNLRATVTRLQ